MNLLKTLFLSLMLMLTTTSIYSQIVYTDHNDTLYPFNTTGMTLYYFDVDFDGGDDLYLATGSINNYPNVCDQTNNTLFYAVFSRVSNTQNQMNGNGGASNGTDCTFDVLNDSLTSADIFSNSGTCYRGPGALYNDTNLCCTIGVGHHYQGFRLRKTVPYVDCTYGYIDYTILSNGDIIIHGWYLNSVLNSPILANGEYQSTAITELDNNYKVYPNPFTDDIKIDMDNVSNIKVLDMLGHILYDGSDKEVNLSFLNGGSYLLVLNNEKYLKIVKN